MTLPKFFLQSNSDGVRQIKTIRILAEELDTNESILPFQPNKIYDLPTPYNSFGVAEVLAQGLGLTTNKINK